MIILCSVVFLRILVSFPNDYCRQSHEINVVRQIERMKSIKEPKIIIIGGSGCGFGLSSSLICKHFSMPVCNTGTNAGMGIIIQLKICEPFIREGDIVVVIPEYDNYMGQSYLGDATVLRIFSSIYPSGYESLSLRQQLHLVQYAPSAFIDAMKSLNWTFLDEEQVCNPYSMKSLNEYGDVECYENRVHQATKDWTASTWKQTRIQKKAIAALQEYDRLCKERGATMLMFPPAFKAMDFDVNKDCIHTIWKSSEEAQLPLVSCPEDYRMADTLHYDTNYHLTYEEVLIRTNRLIKDMDSVLRIYGN